MITAEDPKNTTNSASTDPAGPAVDPAGEGLMHPLSPILSNANALYVWQLRRQNGQIGRNAVRWSRGLWFLAVHYGRRPATFSFTRDRLDRSIFWVLFIGQLEIWFRHPTLWRRSA